MDKYSDEIKYNAIKNALISVVLGDVLGTPVQFMMRDELQQKLKGISISEFILNSHSDIPFGYWSDDSSMTLSTTI